MPQLDRATVDSLWEDPELHAFMLLDGAACPELLDHLYGEAPPEFECLYRGVQDDDMLEVAPYIARLEAGTPFCEWALSGWGEHWGIVVLAPTAFRETRLHFRKLNVVTGPDNNPLLFRYYDPRVLRIVAPTCDAAQLARLFGPVRRFVLEDDGPGRSIALELADGTLVQQQR